MLKPFAWEQINGDTVEAALEEATKQFPAPVKVQIGHRPIVVIDYMYGKKGLPTSNKLIGKKYGRKNINQRNGN